MNTTPQRTPVGRPRRVSTAMTRHSDDEPKTAVNVAVRVRPPIPPSDPRYDLIPPRFRGSTCEVPSQNSLVVQASRDAGGNARQGSKMFLFDHVFDEKATQADIWDYLSGSVESFTSGYNVSILAYGQSGSGKSYTMGTSGPDEQSNVSMAGIVPRAALALFEKLGAGPPKRASAMQLPKRYSAQSLPSYSGQSCSSSYPKSWELKASYVEIYNENPRDLLLPEDTPASQRPQVTIRGGAKGRILLDGLSQWPINSVEDVMNALNFGSSIRQTDSTALNARSSRSHAVFSLYLTQKKGGDATVDKRFSVPVPTAFDGVMVESKLHFVDLAGSERMKDTGATGERAREGIAINGGLAALGKVISQLSTKQTNGFISYRDSRLTRLLQDSLGGNAITYMIACVTPAAFHLNETLNTIHYAQRARAIQSKPEVQLRSDGDSQATMERLRAEVTYLREQLRATTGDRPAESGRREEELQAKLADMEEHYRALRTRHTALVNELSQARDAETVASPSAESDAQARIQRSHAFAVAVDNMAKEYEKTIESLESSLARARSALSQAELDKETQVRHLEQMLHQLQARLQKASERETSHEEYVRDLESRIEGTVDGQERSGSIIADLKKELERARASEKSAEDYIATLEDRLAEAEQDQDAMQQELERLEFVVERQRSVGRLTNLLGELDGSEQTDDGLRPDSPARSVNGSALASTEPDEQPSNKSPAQTDFMADKVENLTQELFDLRSEHEGTLADYDKLQQKYQTALQTLAKLKYGEDDTATPFLVEAGMTDGRQGPSSSRSRPESPSPGVLRSGAEVDGSILTTDAAGGDHLPSDAATMLSKIQTGNVSAMELAASYQTLAQQYESAKAKADELESEMRRSHHRLSVPSTPAQLRRKSEDRLGAKSPKATRAIASLKNMSVETFEDDPERRQGFEQHLNSLEKELQAKTERVQTLERDLGTSRKEVENKSTIISGLTRERSSIAASSGFDIEAVMQMRQKLEESQNHVRSLQERLDEHGADGGVLHKRVEELKASEAQLLATIAGMEKSLQDAQSQEAAFARERAQHAETVSGLQQEVERCKSLANEHTSKLEKSQAEMEEQIRERNLTQQELQTHRDLVANLESQLQVHKEATSTHQDTIESLRAKHARETEELAQAKKALEEEHEGLLLHASKALGVQGKREPVQTRMAALVEEHRELQQRHRKTNGELQMALTTTATLETRNGQLQAKLERVSEREKRSARLVEELEEQLNSNFDSHQRVNNRLSTIQSETEQVRMGMERELDEQKARNAALEVGVPSNCPGGRMTNLTKQQIAAMKRNSAGSEAPARTGSGRKASVTLPTPPPSIPLPPLPSLPNGERTTSPISQSPPASRQANQQQQALLEEQEARLRTVEKHLFAEKQLTSTLEEALVDLETSTNRTKGEMEAYRRKCAQLEEEVVKLRKENSMSKASLQAVEEEREMRLRAERARQALEQRMLELNADGKGKKKKKNALNCF
ncbi:kinesin-domain-containing protein [Piedraia hortae CBS 480.64]|uniref:Kinesin-domain-containing protein n=1 Tax=Piedraia hortae CBS 480.64 TaxID=1314780 RepID=A0A6A7C0H5_9PEZI|nr:kinesin-domain-containing protein [Piedraia hortae CBS 480.64]